MDIKKGDTIRYSYYVYGTQCIANGVVADVKEDGSVVIDQGANELIVEKGSVLERLPRENETKPETAVASKTDEEQFNEMHQGVSIHKKEKVKEEEPEKKVAELTNTNTNKKFNHFGGK